MKTEVVLKLIHKGHYFGFEVKFNENRSCIEIKIIYFSNNWDLGLMKTEVVLKYL